MTFEQGPERGKGVSYVDIFERRYQAEATVCAEVLR